MGEMKGMGGMKRASELLRGARFSWEIINVGDQSWYCEEQRPERCEEPQRAARGY